MKRTINTLLKMKQEGQKISMLTCYDYSTAKLMDKSGVDMILVGDSLGMTMLGYKDTLAVTMEDMIHHGKAVCRGVEDIFVVMDMPFMSYQTSAYDALVNAGRLIKETGASAVKLEGGAAVCEQIKAIVDAGIPVCAHIGMTPQSTNVFGGFKVQGKNVEKAQQIVEDALAVQEAGAFMVVLECIPAKLAAIITEKLDIPTIGIGAGADCDGQVLVWQDMIGLYTDMVPKFVKVFTEGGKTMKEGFEAYDKEVKAGTFPDEAHSFKIDDDVIAQIK
ncbi:MAG: 3-methyl-2-oxobutanoate hydroxymethyltransferase [Firmicutes bacterium]|nr:3-methyl-2-oxobutanoate hydroxymethyltransferase [Bacillota bacterium]MBQ9707730.1 3-methyl-2-oxobutanoate hydroxymethyltransferase [Bacillota bacterium]